MKLKNSAFMTGREKTGEPRVERGKKRGLCLALLVFALLWAGKALAQKAEITDLVVANSKDELLLFFSVKDAFSKDMEDAVRNGIPLTFTFLVELYQVRDNWPDSKIADVSIDHVLTFDSLKEEYTVEHGGSDGKTFVTENLSKAMQVMCEINGYRLIPLSRLQTGGDYTLQVKALLAKRELPFKLHYLIPFYSLWGFNTDWLKLSFRY
jgi:hypothetical protein